MGPKNEGYADICQLCGYSFKIGIHVSDKDRKIQELEQKILQLEHKSGNTQNFMQNFPYWIIPVTVIIFFNLFVFLMIFLTSR